MATNVATPYFETGDVSFRATAAVTGKRFIAPSGDVTGGPGLSTDVSNLFRMAHCGAGLKPAGVAKYDVANGDEGGCYGQPGRIVPVTSGAAVTAGAEVMSDANGKAIPWTSAASEANRRAGQAMSGVGAADADLMVRLY
jgi:hypothetical protein